MKNPDVAHAHPPLSAGSAVSTASAWYEGAPLPDLPKGRLTSSHIVRWCAAQENWDKIHYDQAFARETAGLPGTLINGALKQHFIVQFLANAFGPAVWIWRLDYRFTGMDLVGQELVVRGRVKDCAIRESHVFIGVEIEIWNVDVAKATTLGSAIVVVGGGGKPVLSSDAFNRPQDFCLKEEVVGTSGPVPEGVVRALGSEIETVTSFVPVDLSRLRLFADAVMALDPMHFDPDLGGKSAYGCVVAPALFPLHGVKERPGSRPLSSDPSALGREGVHEIGRNLAALCGLDAKGMLNGGNQVEISSLARVGEYISARSRLVGAKCRVGSLGGEMLMLETLNRYIEAATGRLLVTERQTVIYRAMQAVR